MGDALRCSLDERFFVTIEFDDKYDAQEGRHLICARLQCCEHEEDILAEKKFLWPEMKLPNEAKYLEEDGVLKLFGEDNIAKIALNMDRMLLARLNSTKLRAEVCPVYTSVMKNRQLLTSEPITIAVMNIINGEDVERSWSELVELMSPSRNTKIPAELLYSTFAPWRQKALLDCISSRLGKDGSGKAVLTGFVQQRVFRATDVSLRIAKLVQCEGWFDIALDFIRCALSIDEAVYAVYLKMAHDSIEDSGPELLSALLNHTITHRNLVEQVADKLSGREAAALIDRLVALIDMQELDVDRYRNILELLAVLVDGCAQRMLWDGKCHDAIRRAANCITEEVHLADTISKFGYHSHDSVPHPDPRSDLQYSDYATDEFRAQLWGEKKRKWTNFMLSLLLLSLLSFNCCRVRKS